MYYKATGELKEKFIVVVNRAKEIQKEISAFLKELKKEHKNLDAESWFQSPWSFVGISGVIFDGEYDKQYWAKIQRCRALRPRRCKKNKELIDKFDAIPKITVSEVAKVAGVDWLGFGYKMAGKEIYYCISSGHVKTYEPPEGAVEVFASEYMRAK